MLRLVLIQQVPIVCRHVLHFQKDRCLINGHIYSSQEHTVCFFGCCCCFFSSSQGILHSSLADIDECSEGSDNCGMNAECLDTPGSYDCRCSDGYEGNGFTCTGTDTKQYIS